ncbi:MAG: carbohydrate kinase [Bacteroidetes bacterium]|nr:MAG: carbohydrate kinase [Bacteroidota bacterium]
MNREAVLIFDLGKTNKKVLVFDRALKLLHEDEQVFDETTDEDGFEADDIEGIEAWIGESCQHLLNHPGFEISGINFCSYGASLVYLDDAGKRIGPLYNYLKTMPEGIAEALYERHGGAEEFCRKTASPALGMLNSGLQPLWLQKCKPAFYSQVKHILHLPQYLCYLLSGKIGAEHCSIGCHTALWDFEQMCYHPWTRELGRTLPEPLPVESSFPATVAGKDVACGIGIHDSSASLAPYFMHSDQDFMLLSTGTWCISMNPFNPEPLSAEELKNDCLSYLSIQQKPVKSARFFLGHIHDLNVDRLCKAFSKNKTAYKEVGLNRKLLNRLMKEAPTFFAEGLPEAYLDRDVDLTVFTGFEEAYHRFMIDLTKLAIESVRLVIPKKDRTKRLYISGGFSKNPIFLELLRMAFPEKRVLAADIANASSLGAAMVLWKSMDRNFTAPVKLTEDSAE